MQQPFLTYRKYYDLEVIKGIAEILQEYEIPYEIENDTPGFDPSFAFDALVQEYRLKLHSEDFERADKILKDVAKNQVYELPEDYYLYDFKDEELMDILVKPDEWGKLDYILAQKLLNERGIDVDDQFLDGLRKQRIQELSKEDSVSKTWLIVGYVFAILGGLIGILIGFSLAFHKKTLPNGDRIYAYNPQIRKHGRQILFIGTTVLLIVIGIGIFIIANEVGFFTDIF